MALTFLVENFLGKLKERGCVFHVAFFNVYESIWNNRPELRIAREIIIDHLESHDTKVPVFKFEDWWSRKWEKYLENRQPLFILTGDGSTEHLEIKGKKERKYYDHSSISGIATEKSLNMTVVFQAFMFRSLHIELPIAR